MQGCNSSADSVAGIAGSQTPALFTSNPGRRRKIPGVRGQSPRFTGVTESLSSYRDIIAELNSQAVLNAECFSSPEELAKVAADWPTARLIEI